VSAATVPESPPIALAQPLLRRAALLLASTQEEWGGGLVPSASGVHWEPPTRRLLHGQSAEDRAAIIGMAVEIIEEGAIGSELGPGLRGRLLAALERPAATR
jgi:hypothetical protein